jgi:hypothetical protein
MEWDEVKCSSKKWELSQESAKGVEEERWPRKGNIRTGAQVEDTMVKVVREADGQRRRWSGGRRISSSGGFRVCAARRRQEGSDQ